MLKTIKKLFKKYDHAVLLLYYPVYLLVFCLIEAYKPDKIHIISCSLDQMIPFCEYFVIPYLAWFVYIAVTAAWFFFREKQMFRKFMYYGMIGMTTFLVVSVLWPNGLELRPQEFAGDNICIRLTRWIYSIDTARNVLPSIHVFNSMAAYHCITQSESLKDKTGVRRGALLLTVLIILSTMFLKQHSVFDVATGLVMAFLCNELIFNQKGALNREPVGHYRLKKKAPLKYKEQ